MRHFYCNLSGLALLFLVVACGNSGGGSSDSGNVNVVLRSSSLRRSKANRAGTNCSVSYESTTVLGKCYSPESVTGAFSQASFSSTGGGTPVRIIGGGSSTGFANIFLQEAFDLTTSPSIAGSDDNIQDGGGTYNLVSLTLQALNYQFVADSGNQVYNIRIPFADTAPSTGTALSGCGLSSGELATLLGAQQPWTLA